MLLHALAGDTLVTAARTNHQHSSRCSYPKLPICQPRTSAGPPWAWPSPDYRCKSQPVCLSRQAPEAPAGAALQIGPLLSTQPASPSTAWEPDRHAAAPHSLHHRCPPRREAAGDLGGEPPTFHSPALARPPRALACFGRFADR